MVQGCQELARNGQHTGHGTQEKKHRINLGANTDAGIKQDQATRNTLCDNAGDNTDELTKKRRSQEYVNTFKDTYNNLWHCPLTIKYQQSRCKLSFWFTLPIKSVSQGSDITDKDQ